MLNEQELLELARQLYLSGFFVIHDNNYPNKTLASDIEEKVCSTGFHEFNQQGHYEPGGPTEAAFRLSLEEADALEASVESFKKSVIRDFFAEQLAERDFEEKYGPEDKINFEEEPHLLLERQDMQLEYEKDFAINGLRNLRLIRIGKN